ncbi:Atu4866 domain-containing protein [Schlegelella sp. S2-27]|uniref:Atu4866 domain-containing protein n=1 Tax=Caldimonas mangrovi TaxID=2944811 RepID=A0ABT0YQR4_9BURK|nr:Atu4866 domain-containing protein [Caldimonas mangrovi]MCM5680674.1 Atu4866 domain-containing protein [Caldimonas mangrovi]
MTLRRHFIAAAPLALATPMSGQALARAGDAPTERNRQFIRQAFEKWAAGGTTFFRDVLAPDVRWTVKGTSPAAGTYQGFDDFMKRAVVPFASRLSTPIRPTVRDLWAEGSDVIVHWDGAGVAADGMPYRNSYVWIFRMNNLRATEVIAFLDLAPYDDVIRRVPAPTRGDAQMNPHPYTGMWVTDDGQIRHELLPNGRYDEARGSRQSAYQGRYEVQGNRVEYWDDTGFTADGVFVDQNTLHHGGMIFRRR